MVHPIVPALCAFLMPLAAWADESSVEGILPALGKVGVSARQAAAVEVEVVLQGGHSSETGVVEPFNIDFDEDGAMYGVEFIKGNRVFKRTPDGTVTFIAGRKIATTEKTSDVAEGDGGLATAARFNGMHDLCLTYSDADRVREGKPEDVILIADTFNHRIRQINLTTGLVTTIAGTGKPGDGDPIKPSAATMLNTPIALCRPCGLPDRRVPPSPTVRHPCAMMPWLCAPRRNPQSQTVPPRPRISAPASAAKLFPRGQLPLPVGGKGFEVQFRPLIP